MDKRGWELPFRLRVRGRVCGPSVVRCRDHQPCAGSATATRSGIIAQPDWKDQESIQILGEPRLGWLVSAGNMDSMVNHYSVSKKRRAKDSYTPVFRQKPNTTTRVLETVTAWTSITKRMFKFKFAFKSDNL